MTKQFFLVFIGIFLVQVLIHVVFQKDKTVLEMVGISTFIAVFWWLFDYIFSRKEKKNDRC